MTDIKIVPAVLVESFSEAKKIIQESESFASVVQIDICDGSVTPKKTWPCSEKSGSVLVTEDFEMPGWQNIDFEVDLYTNKPSGFVELVKNIGASKVILHAKYCDEKELYETIDALLRYDISIGLGVMYDSKIEDIQRLVEYILSKNVTPYLQIMGITKVGEQGQNFEPLVLKKIKELKTIFPTIEIQVDGAVSPQTIRSLHDAGAQTFVVGSWFKSEKLSIGEGIHILKSLVY